jgi:GTP cyclohydrolase II
MSELTVSQLPVTREASASIPTAHGTFQLAYFSNTQDDKEHLAFYMGDLTAHDAVLARVHSECFTGDVLGSRRCDCGEQLDAALAMVAKAGVGVVLYLRQEGRGIGLLEKLRAYNLQDEGYDTVESNLMLGHEADARDYTLGAAMLEDLGVKSVRLMTNNPAKISALTAAGIKVSERVPIEIPANTDNFGYLSTKAARMDHMLELEQGEAAKAAGPAQLAVVSRTG